MPIFFSQKPILHFRTSTAANAEKFGDDLNRLFKVLVLLMSDQRNETLKIQVRYVKEFLFF
jgi:hypothetical protein